MKDFLDKLTALIQSIEFFLTSIIALVSLVFLIFRKIKNPTQENDNFDTATNQNSHNSQSITVQKANNINQQIKHGKGIQSIKAKEVNNINQKQSL